MDQSHHGPHRHQGSPGATPRGIAIDPVCGMEVDTAATDRVIVHDGVSYYFCNDKCVALFKANPAEFIADAAMSPEEKSAARAAAAPPGSQYTCPMHPEIVRDAPGACPICGMALEPMSPLAAAEEENPELAYMTLRFWTALALTVPILALGMLPQTWVAAVVPATVAAWLMLALATPVVIWAGAVFFERGYASLRSMNLNMFTLIASGVGVAYGYSVIATVFPGIFPPAMRDAHGMIPAYFEAAASIVVLVLLGQVLELRARSRTSGAIRALLGLAPRTARRIADDGSESDVALDEVHPGDRLRVRPGEKIPVDGVVLEGNSSIDEVDDHRRADSRRKETGRPRDRRHRERHRQLRDARRARRRGNAARADRPDGRDGAAQPRADSASGRPWSRRGSCRAWSRPRSSPLSYGSLRALAAWPRDRQCGRGADHRLPVRARTGDADGDHGRHRTRRERRACCCATPRRSRFSKRSIRCVIDKTGTLTEGQPRLAQVIALDGADESEILRLAASIERGSEHPLAAAITAGAAARGIVLNETSGFRAIAGKGVIGVVDGRSVALGNAALFAELGIDVSAASRRAPANFAATDRR